MVGRVFPVNTYLRCIDKHPTGDCSWCGKGVPETQARFQCCCPQFETNCTAAHHLIAHAVVASLKDLWLPNWTFFYETEFADLPFKFKWASALEERKQIHSRPDGVAWNPVLGQVIFLEFSRVMDNPDNMLAACEAKGKQYKAAMLALLKAQRNLQLRHTKRIHSVITCPLIFGVRCTVLMDVANESLAPMALKPVQLQRVLAIGVRAAITAALDMCCARFAVLRSLPARPRGANGKRVKVVIPPKPAKLLPWRGDRGCG